MNSMDNSNLNSVLSGFNLTPTSYIHIPFPPCLVLKGTRVIKLEYYLFNSFFKIPQPTHNSLRILTLLPTI